MEESSGLMVFNRIEDEGKKNIFKYFDRIHDKLFTFNNIMIAGFFAISKTNTDISMVNILTPILNLVIILYIEWKFMEISRKESNITEIPVKDLPKKLYRHYKIVTRLSLISIITTGFVVSRFVYLILK